MRAAALRLFAQHGYAAVSMRQIAAEVGLQAGALYSYTPDKQSLLSTMLIAHFEALGAVQEHLAPSTDPTQRLQAFTQFHLRFHIDALQTSELARLELRNLAPENRAQVDALRAVYRDALAQILQEGAHQKMFAIPEVGLATSAVLGLLSEAVLWASASDLPHDRVARIVWNMVRRAVGARGFQ